MQCLRKTTTRIRHRLDTCLSQVLKGENREKEDIVGMLEGKVALITGASSGIGRATALAFARNGIHVAGTARRGDRLAELETEILKRINDLGIGAMGYGGRITALAVHAEVFPTHIASLPVAVNLQCHSVRHWEAIL